RMALMLRSILPSASSTRDFPIYSEQNFAKHSKEDSDFIFGFRWKDERLYAYWFEEGAAADEIEIIAKIPELGLPASVPAEAVESYFAQLFDVHPMLLLLPPGRELVDQLLVRSEPLAVARAAASCLSGYGVACALLKALRGQASCGAVHIEQVAHIA